MLLLDTSPAQLGGTMMVMGDRTARAMEVLTRLHKPMKRKYGVVRMFLMIANHHPRGIAQSELVGTPGIGSAVDPDRQNVSRWKKLLGDDPYLRLNAPNHSQHLGLITEAPAHDGRTILLRLTRDGERVIREIDGR